jgi:hypothetical protein
MQLKRLAGLLIVVSALDSARAEELLPKLVAVEPLVGLQNGDVRQCGLKAKFVAETDRPLTLEIALERGQGGSIVAVRVIGAPPAATVAIATQDPLPKFAAAHSDTAVALQAPADSPEATDFLRRAMIAGVRVDMGYQGLQQRLEINGPVPQSVRAAYLNCAGDLYRPGE